MSDLIFSVSEVTSRIKDRIESDGILSHVNIRGEISNFKLHSSGHAYFTLKDKNAVIRSVMFRSSFYRVDFRPRDGMEVQIRGRISVYEKDGTYQLYAEQMTAGGTGALAKAFEELKAKLEAEGLFDQDRKRKIPTFPNTVGVITSETGAAVRDIIKVLHNRCPVVKILLYPVQVQGEQSAKDIQKAIRWFNENEAADVLILGRGGGSMEELWSFNEEIVARSIAASNIPIISAVGHETDFTISDFTADLRAATPSNAAELAVPEWRLFIKRVENDRLRLEQGLRRKMEAYGDHLKWEKKTMERAMERYLLNKGSGLERMKLQLDRGIQELIRDKKIQTEKKNEVMDLLLKDRLQTLNTKTLLIGERLQLLNPDRVLKLGYSILEKDHRILSSVKEINIGDKIDILLKDGRAVGKIQEVAKNGHEKEA